jgi:hypothetical protein
MQLSSSMQTAHIAKPVKPSEPEAPPGGNIENRQPPSEPPPPPPANAASASDAEERNNAQNSGHLSADIMSVVLKAQEEAESVPQERAEITRKAGDSRG